jgi:multiple sugar transport system substrate-binding protein
MKQPTRTGLSTSKIENESHMKQTIPWLVVLSIGGLTLLGGNELMAQSQDQSSTASNGSDKKVELVISRWAGGNADDQAALLSEFENKTGIHVRMDAIDYGQLRQKQMLNMGGKTGAYDLVFAQEVWIPEYVAAGYLRPLDEYVHNETLSGKDFDFADFEPSLIKLNSFDGKLYGLPTFVQTPLVVYNKDVFAKDSFQPPKTWEETLAIAKKLKEKGTGIAVPAKEGLAAVDIWIALNRSNNGDYFNSAGKLEMPSPENIETGKFWKELIDVSMRGSTNWHFDDVNKAVQFGQAPYGMTVSGLAGNLEDPKQSKVAGKIGYLPLPYSKKPFGTLSFWSWCLTADSKHPDEAYQLAAWLTSKDIEKRMGLKDGQVCARQSVLNDTNLTSKLPFFPAIAESLKNANTQPRDKNGPKLMDAVAAALSKIAVNGADPKTEFEAIQQQLAADFQ